MIAAVAGYALGGGCELAMMCDFILAADNAKFGQPEITLGFFRARVERSGCPRVGKSKAMDMCLTGRMMDAEGGGAFRSGRRIVRRRDLMDEAHQGGRKIAELSQPVVMMAKEASIGPSRRRLRGRSLRAAAVPFRVRDRGPEGRHGRLCRKAQAAVQEPVGRCERAVGGEFAPPARSSLTMAGNPAIRPARFRCPENVAPSVLPPIARRIRPPRPP